MSDNRQQTSDILNYQMITNETFLLNTIQALDPDSSTSHQHHNAVKQC